MLVLNVTGIELYNDKTEQFETTPDFTVTLEHSLVSLSKWESKHEKPFLGKDEKTLDETLDYIESMLVSSPAFLPQGWVHRFSEEDLETIHNYIDAKRSATWFSDLNQRPENNGEVITSELVYYWLIAFQIPFECETWHLSRLFTLIRICSAKNSKPKKMTRSEIAARNRELNAKRKAELGTKG